MAIIYTNLTKRNRTGKLWAVMIDGVIICYCADMDAAFGLLV